MIDYYYYLGLGYVKLKCICILKLFGLFFFVLIGIENGCFCYF